MPEQVLVTLNAKRKDIESYIGSLEADLEQARCDLSGILAAIKVFSAEGPKVTPYMQLTKMFPRYELPRLAKDALEAAPDGISTTGIAARVMTAKGLDSGNRHLRKSITYKVVQLMRRWERERRVKRAGKEGTAVVWRPA